MDLGRPHASISHPLDGAVLTALAGTTQPVTGRQVARLAPEGSQPGVWKALTRLSEAGLVLRQEAGNATLYSLNRAHLAAPAVELLTDLRGALISRLREELASWEIPPLHASAFGSLARGDGDSHSDVDVLLIRPEGVDLDDARWRDQLAALSASVHGWTGNQAGISELSEDDLERLRRERPPIVESLLADSLTLHGPDIRTLLREHR